MSCTHKGREAYAHDPELLARYDLAIKHTAKARENGMSSEEAHAMFTRIMNGETLGNCKAKRAEQAEQE